MQEEYAVPEIDATLAARLVADQFPRWAGLPVEPVAHSGWDNRTFRLGGQMLVRLPSAAQYASQVAKEHQYLPQLAPLLPLAIPEPLVMGKPARGYPWPWSVYRWIEGSSACHANVADMLGFAQGIARFLLALRRIDASGEPSPGMHSFYRGAGLAIYDAQTRKAIAALRGNIDDKAAIRIWEAALSSAWEPAPVWVHGDISAGNLLVREGRLHAVIDFGQLTVGDPACDAVMAWSFFRDESRAAFRDALALDEATWARSRAWALWKAVIVASGFAKTNAVEWRQPWNVISEVLAWP